MIYPIIKLGEYLLLIYLKEKLSEEIVSNIPSDKKSYSSIKAILIMLIVTILGNVLYKPFWNLLISWSNVFSLFLVKRILKFAIKGKMPIEVFSFVFLFFAFLYLTNLSPFFEIKKKIIVNKSRILDIVISIFFLVIFIYVVTTYTLVFNINTDFEQKIGIIAPYINNEIEEELWSKWYLMESKVDYLNLAQEIEKIAENNDIKLP